MKLDLLALATLLALSVSSSFAKLGGTQADFEKQYGKVQPAPGADQIQTLLPDIQVAGTLGTNNVVGVVVRLGKVVAEFHPAADDAAVLNALKEATSAEDWNMSNTPSTVTQLAGFQTYVDKDDKFVVA